MYEKTTTAQRIKEEEIGHAPGWPQADRTRQTMIPSNGTVTHQLPFIQFS